MLVYKTPKSYFKRPFCNKNTKIFFLIENWKKVFGAPKLVFQALKWVSSHTLGNWQFFIDIFGLAKSSNTILGKGGRIVHNLQEIDPIECIL